MYSKIKAYCDNLSHDFELISFERRLLLEKISAYITVRKDEGKLINLVYICTHNSRRSHFGQIWAQVAAYYYKIKNVNAFSGGTEATAFNSNAINAIERIGFEVKRMSNDINAMHHVYYSENITPISCFSKVYDHSQNPKNNFAAIMTCSDAEENCPFIPGVDIRIGTTYEDPKAFDNTLLQDSKYDERAKQIALETLYVFSLIK
jgi:protein-tyrosine phosphatase/arsenate reductase